MRQVVGIGGQKEKISKPKRVCLNYLLMFIEKLKT